MSDQRAEVIADLDRRRTGFGPVGAGAVRLTSPTCGDEVTIDVDHDGAVIRSVSWRGHGCTVSMASASALAGLMPGLGLDEFAALKREFGESVRGQPPTGDLDVDHPLGDAVAFAGIGRLPLRAGCATLPWAAAAQALLR